MKENNQDFVTTVVLFLIKDIPSALAKWVLEGVKALKKKLSPRIFLVSIICLFAGYLLGFVGIFKYKDNLIDLVNSSPSLAYRIGLGFSGAYGFYIFSVLPVFVFTVYLAQKHFNRELEEDVDFVKNLGSKDMNLARHQSDDYKVFLGLSKTTGKPVFLTKDMRIMHCQVIGSTGSGKTDSVLMPLLAHDIASGKGALIVDTKGDLEVYGKIEYMARKFNRTKDFLFFSLSHPKSSFTYNPLLRGNATEIKDKLIGSTVHSEPFYQKKTEEILLLVLKGYKLQNKTVTFANLYHTFQNEHNFSILAEKVPDQAIKGILLNLAGRFRDLQRWMTGFIADLALVSQSEFSCLVNTEKPEIDLLEAYQSDKIVYFQLNTQGYEETAKRFGRIVLQDIKTVSNYIQSYIPENKRHFYPVFIDEFASFAYPNFVEVLNKARGAGLAITLAHQSLGDLVRTGEYFLRQVIENTNIKIILRQDDPASIELYTKMAGTYRTVKSTMQTREGLLSKELTGLGSMREVNEFRLKPNILRVLKRGEAGLIIKNPDSVFDYVKLDYIGKGIDNLKIPQRDNKSTVPRKTENLKKEKAIDRVKGKVKRSNK